MAKVQVLKVPSRSYNPNRVVSSLLKTQIQQLQLGVLNAVDTEGEAAHCIRVLRKLLEDLRPQIAPMSHQSAGKPVAPSRTENLSGRQRRTRAVKR